MDKSLERQTPEMTKTRKGGGLRDTQRNSQNAALNVDLF